LRAVDVATAACAAPAYFPSVRLDGRLYADGGLFAVAPDQVALHEAEHFIGIDAARVRCWPSAPRPRTNALSRR